jgi:general secretion pathway protein G
MNVSPIGYPRPSTLRPTSRRAFTLIEMLLVIVIIGVLASGLAVSLSGRGEEARTARAKSDLAGQLSLALDLFEQDFGRYPTTEEGLNVLVQTNGDTKWKGPYLKTGLKPDPWDHPYVYQYNAETGKYTVFSMGADGRSNTPDDVIE